METLHPSLIEQRFNEIIAQYPSNKIVLGYSGGLDSSVLLRLLKQAQKKRKLIVTVVHINHQISKNAKYWKKFCKRECKNLDFKFVSKKIFIDQSAKQGFESEARSKRYKIFKNLAPYNGIICTAHHLDDQIETFFIRMLRGSGIKGLSAIKAFRKDKKSYVARPLLGFSRQQLENYAKVLDINYIHDESNDGNKYDRNYLRNELMPILKKRYPSYQKTFMRSILHIQNVSKWMDKIAKRKFRDIKVKNSCIYLEKFITYSLEEQILVLRYWFEKNKCQQPSTKKLDNILKQITEAKALSIKVDKKIIKKYQNHCYLIKNIQRVVPNNKIIWDTRLRKKLAIKSINKTLEVKTLLKLNIDIKNSPVVEIDFRRGGETVLINKVGQLSLKKFFQNHAIPKWERPFIPLIYINNKLSKVYLD